MSVTVDFGRRSDDYRVHRPPPPPSAFDRLAGYARIEGAQAVDLGTGPGVAALELAARGATVTGVDIAEGQIAAARVAAGERGLADRCTFRTGAAEHTGLGAGAFDLVTAAQCFRWFDVDRVRAEVVRLLREGGTFAIIQYDYLAPLNAVAAATERLILEFNPTWPLAGKDGLYPEFVRRAPGPGLRFVEQICYDYEQAFSHEAWRGRIRTCNGVGSGGMTPEQVQAFDRAHAALLAERFPTEPLGVTHRLFMVVLERVALP